MGSGDHPWTVIGEDDLGGTASGRLSVSSLQGTIDGVSAVLVLDSRLNGLPRHSEIVFTAERVGEAGRSLGIELELEEGVDWPVSVEFAGRQVTLGSCLSAAGFAFFEVGEKSAVPRTQSGWGLSQLHTLMQDLAAASLAERVWELHLLLLSQSDRQGLLGVMFDETQALPRQGVAIFADAIRGIPGINHERKLIQDDGPRARACAEPRSPLRAGRRARGLDLVHEL